MNIIRTFGDLAQEFLEQEVEDFEYMLATQGDQLVIDEYVWRDNWQGFGNYDPLINVTMSLLGGKDVCLDAMKEEDYTIICEELDAFLLRKNEPDYLNIEKNSGAYKVLARRFLLAQIQAYGIMEDMCSGKPYDYKYKDGASKLELDNIKNSSIYNSVQKWKSSSSKYYQTLVNKKAKEIMKQYPKITKEQLSEDVYSKLKLEKPIASTILRDYLDNYPNF